jgi:hypothetical protein
MYLAWRVMNNLYKEINYSFMVAGRDGQNAKFLIYNAHYAHYAHYTHYAALHNI